MTRTILHANLMTGRRRMSFTLMELLVVVMIIAILMAMLLPSLARAKYTAKLVVCASNLRQLGSSVLMYAQNNSGKLPKRGAFNETWGRPDALRGAGNAWDDRPFMSTYFPLNELLNCPLAPGKVDLTQTGGDELIRGTYFMYWGWHYGDGGGHDGLDRAGDTWWHDANEFNVMAVDKMARAGALFRDGHRTSSHPDPDGVIDTYYHNDATTGEVQSVYRDFLEWDTAGGSMDMNCLTTDGSVQRYNSVRANDPRMTKVPLNYSTGFSGKWIQLPGL